MAYSIIQAVVGSNYTTSLAVAFTNPNVGNRLLVALVTGTGSGLSISDSRNGAWTQAAIYNASAPLIGLFYLANCAAGTNTVTLSAPGSSSTSLTIFEVYGASTVSPVDTSGTLLGTYGTTTPSISLTTATDGDLIIGGCYNGSATLVCGAGFISVTNTGAYIALEQAPQTTHGAISIPFSAPGGGSSRMVAVAFTPNTVAFSYKRSITTDYTQCGTVDSTNFPVLVNISDATLKTVANGGHVQSSSGYDICFFSDSTATTPLYWEMDYYDGTNGVVWAWVKLATLSHTANVTFYVLYGDSSRTAFQSVASMAWNSNYAAAFHFGTPSSISGVDSTKNAITLTNNNVTATTGRIGGAASFNGSTAYLISASNSLVGYAGSNNFSVQYWVYPTANNTSNQDMVGRDGANLPSWNCQLYYSGGHLNFTFATDSGNSVVANASSYFNVWTKVDCVQVGNASTTLFLNSNSIATRASVNDSYAANYLSIGGNNSGATLFTGYIDEVRILTTNLSTSWLTAEYNNQKASSTFLTIGSETAVGGTQYTQTLTAGTATMGGLLNNITVKRFAAATATMSGGLIRAAIHTTAAAMAACSGALSRSTNKLVTAATATMSGALAKQADKTIAATMATMAGALSSIKTTVLILTATMAAMAGGISRKTFKLVPATTATMSGAVTKASGKLVAASMAAMAAVVARSTRKAIAATTAAMSGAVTSARARVLAIAATMAAMAGGISRKTFKSTGASTAPMAGTLSRSTNKTLAAATAPMAATVSKTVNKVVNAVLAVCSGAFAYVFHRVVRPQPGRRIRVPAEYRASSVQADSRATTVQAEDRSTIVPRGNQ